MDAVRDCCLILATDGVWNVLNMAVETVFDSKRNNKKFMINPQVRLSSVLWINTE